MSDTDPPEHPLVFEKKPVEVHAKRLAERTEINTREGTLVGERGDWLIKGIEGELYPCDDEIFRETYRPKSASARLELDKDVPHPEDTPDGSANSGESAAEVAARSPFESTSATAPVGGVSPLEIPTSRGAHPDGLTSSEALRDPVLAFVLGMGATAFIWLVTVLL